MFERSNGSDVTSPEQRTKIYRYSSTVFGAGLIFGPTIGGITPQISFAVPMCIAAFISLVSIVLVILFLLESIKEKNKHVRMNLMKVKDIIRYFRILRVRRCDFNTFYYFIKQ